MFEIESSIFLMIMEQSTSLPDDYDDYVLGTA
jgi:hypothetical protein